MRKRTWFVWGVLTLCGLVVACSQPQAKKPQAKAARGGPAVPELDFRETSDVAERAPITLTASDGSGLELVALHARTVIEDPLAFTELHLTFSNPEPRRREGRFSIVLPPRAAIARFALRVGDQYQEGEVVERRRAQQVYEDFLHRKQDPALLEKAAGNEFSARVFPIEPNAQKEIIVAYSQELERADAPYRLLLGGLPKVRDIKVDVQVGGTSASGRESSASGPIAQLKLYDHDFIPQGDLEVRLPWHDAVALRSGELVVARVTPELTHEAAPIAGLTVLFDTSASRALGYHAQVQRLSALLSELRRRGGDFALRVIAFDQDASEVYRGQASGFGAAQQAALLERDALGATDLARALALVARGAEGMGRVLVIGDGVVTAGADDSTALREGVAKLAAHGVERLDVLAEGGIRDGETLRSLASAGLAHSGVVLDARAAISQLADKLLVATTARVEVQIAGANWVYPKVLQAVQPGDQRLVFAELSPQTPLQIELVGAGIAAPELRTMPRPLLERALARAKLEAMTSELRALPADASSARAKKEQAIVALSLAQRVVCDLTSLLVLERDEDYARFGIDQKALTNILRVGAQGVEVIDRSELIPKAQRWKVAKDDAEREPRELEVPLPSEGEMVVTTPPSETSAATPLAAAAPPRAKQRAAAVARPALRQASAEPLRAAERSVMPAPPPRAKSPPPMAAPAIADKSASEAAVGSGSDMPMAPAKKVSPRVRSAETAPGHRPATAAAAAPRRSAALAQRKAAPRPAAVASTGEPRGHGAGVVGGAAQRLVRDAPVPASPVAIAAPELEARARVLLRTAQGLPGPAAAQALRAGLTARARGCYERARARGGNDRISIELTLSDKGTVRDAYVSGRSVLESSLQSCILAAARRLHFPKPDAGSARVSAGIELSMQPVRVRPPRVVRRPARRSRAVHVPTPAIEDAYSGVLAEVLALLRDGAHAQALERARGAHADDPGDVIALVALGEALEANSDYARAARAYGSIIDLFPARADLRRMAAARLERLPRAALALAADSYRRAVEQRPDQPSGARSLAYVLWKLGDHEGAFTTLERALDRAYPSDRFEGVDRILREDLALIGSAWRRADPSSEARIRASLQARGLAFDHTPSLRFVLSWETDANDVDFHIYDGRGGHAYYLKPKLASGGSLYADITTGYGPECFAISGRARAFPYVLQAHYFARGPMGYGMGKLQVIEHDGHGGLHFAEHPFVIMKDKAFVELARLSSPLG